jgi:lipoprotein-anchoring transpeptidase ErfK/SrfK
MALLSSIFALGFVFLLTNQDKATINELGNDSYIRFIKEQNGDWNDSTIQPIFLNQPVNPPVKIARNKENILSSSTPNEDKWIEVKLSEPQTLYAHEGDKIVYTFLISAGKWAPTPRGQFQIWGKYRYSTMVGGSIERGDYYNLPNVPFTMYFWGGVGLHGTYWHNNFGKPMSHGCINMAIPDAEKLFYWAGPIMPENKNAVFSNTTNPGTKVVVYD